MLAPDANRRIYDGTMAEVDAIEIAHGDYHSPGDRSSGGGVAYHGKVGRHPGVLQLAQWARDRDLGRMIKSSHGPRALPGSGSDTICRYPVNELFNGWWYSLKPNAGALWLPQAFKNGFRGPFRVAQGIKMAVDLSMSVLVVDDYNTMIRIIRNLLKQLGFDNIDDASDGSAALNKMRSKKYGLVISDWNMEPMTGYDLLREVRADPNLATTPFIMITAESKTENVIAAKKAGVNNYIVKPFNAATLKTKIEAVFPDLASA